MSAWHRAPPEVVSTITMKVQRKLMQPTVSTSVMSSFVQIDDFQAHPKKSSFILLAKDKGIDANRSSSLKMCLDINLWLMNSVLS